MRLALALLLSTICLRLAALDGLDARDREGLLHDLNNCAWALATDAAISDGDAAVALARVMQDVGGLPAFMLDTVAASLARSGDLVRAAKVQTEAVALARSERSGDLAGYQQRLDLFRQGNSFTEHAAQKTRPFVRKSADGTLLEAGQVNDNGSVGRWQRCFPNGRIEHVCMLHDGQRTGRWERWRADGTPVENGYYFQNRRLGPWYEYQDGGKKLAEGLYHDTTEGDQGRVGRWYFWHPNGNVACQGNYVAGQRIGRWEFFTPEGNPQGTPTTVVTYRDLPAGFGVRDKVGELPAPVQDDAKIGANDF